MAWGIVVCRFPSFQMSQNLPLMQRLSIASGPVRFKYTQGPLVLFELWFIGS